MTWWQVFFSAVAAVVVFLFSLQSFSHELQVADGETLKAWGTGHRQSLERVIGPRGRNCFSAVRSAVTALAVTLIDAGVVSFKASLGSPVDFL